MIEGIVFYKHHSYRDVSLYVDDKMHVIEVTLAPISEL